MTNLPRLDASNFNFLSEQQRTKFGQDLVQSFRDHGFVRLINYGIDQHVVGSLIDSSHGFFGLQDDVKEEIFCVRGPHPQRGWSRVGSEQTAKLRKENVAKGNANELMDEREHFDAGPLEDTQYPNKWPSEEAFPSFKPFMEEVYGLCQETCLKIMECMEVGLELAPGTLVKRCERAASEIRLNHYPPVSLEKLADGKVKRTWPHTDFGIITLLFQDEVGGLELEDRAHPGTFVPVTPTPPGQKLEMVVNISNTFQRWTNDVITAGLHQVTAPPAWKASQAGILPERHSCVFFFKASRGVSVGPLTDFVTEANPAKYDEVTALEYQQRMTKELY